MKKKSLILIGTILGAFCLAGCQQNASKVTKQSGSGTLRTNKSNLKTNTNNDSNSDSEDNNNSSSNWNSEKQDKLDDFFDDWSETMKQNYDKYDGSGQIETAAGEEFPKDFDKVYVNNQKVSMTYEPSGRGSSDYNVVAIYNYDKDGASHITYFFAFHNGQPIVLVDETTNGDRVLAKETANKDLINGFNDIAAGKNATMTASGETSSDSSDTDTDTNASDTEDPKLIGTFVGLLESGDWFKENIKEGMMYFGTNWNHGKMKGYDYITANGDPTSYFWFKQNGDTVTVKYVDASHSDSVAEAPIKTEHFTVEHLKSDYYVNSGQKQEVNSYVAKLKPISEANH